MHTHTHSLAHSHLFSPLVTFVSSQPLIYVTVSPRFASAPGRSRLFRWPLSFSRPLFNSTCFSIWPNTYRYKVSQFTSDLSRGCFFLSMYCLAFSVVVIVPLETGKPVHGSVSCPVILDCVSTARIITNHKIHCFNTFVWSHLDILFIIGNHSPWDGNKSGGGGGGSGGGWDGGNVNGNWGLDESIVSAVPVASLNYSIMCRPFEYAF